MFIGHFAVALAAKRATPRTSLGWLFAACQLPDLLWPVLLLAGVEHARLDPGNTAFTPLAFDHYPWSHSLLTVTVLGVLLGGAYLVRRGDRKAAATLVALVVSHWVLDWLTHAPDLPLAPQGTLRFGFGLWNSVAGTLLVEGLMFAAGVWLYTRTTSGRNRIGRAAWVSLAAFLVVTYLANAFGPPPPSMGAVAGGGLAIWLLVLWAWWADSHRADVAGANAPTLAT